jgi:hypothetical protein
MDEQTLWQQLLQIIIPFAVTALSVLTTWALFELRKYIKSRTDSEQLIASLDVLDQVVQNAVAKINETVKQVGADGVITKDEAIALKQAALTAIDEQLPPATFKILNIWIDKLNDFISGKIEVAVLTTKRLKVDAGVTEPRMPPA